MQKTPTFNTGYESRLPFGSEFKIGKSMYEMGKEKGEDGYLSYLKQIYSHVLLGLIQKFKREDLLDDFQIEILKVPDAIKRIQILNKVYLACRCFDNVIDGDSPVLLSSEELRLYAEVAERHFINEKWDKNFVPDKYFSEALSLCLEISIDIKTQILYVIKSMKFDAERRSRFLESGEIEFMPEFDLKKHYYLLDIEGTVCAMLEIVNEKNTLENRNAIQPLGEVMRIFYDIRDLKKETNQGLCNIPQEDAEEFNITKELLTNWAKSDKDLKDAPVEILNWTQAKMREAESLMKDFDKNLEVSDFKFLTKMFFDKQYVKHYEQFKRNNTFLLN